MKDKPEKTRLSVTLTPVYQKALDEVVEEGLYLDRQVAIRAALRLLFKFHGKEAFIDKGAELEGDATSEH